MTTKVICKSLQSQFSCRDKLSKLEYGQIEIEA
jgi:hypothetical protein